MRARIAVLAGAACIAGAATIAGGGCDAASPDPGLGARLQVEGAQFRPGAFPVADGGPNALALTPRHSQITIGQLDERVRGVLAPTARAAVIGIAGEDGTWIVPAGPPELDTPGQPVATARFGVEDDFPPGPFTLVIAGSDEHGRFGEPASTTIIANPEAPPTGELVIGLVWEGPADLDLHVVAPDGEAWSDDPNTQSTPPPGTPVDPNAWMLGGILDHDGNKDCRRDGRPTEHVVWQVAPPAGTYVVRVDAPSLCGAPIASWYAVAYRGDTLVGTARGVATPDDVLKPRGRGAGMFAFEFELPP